LKKTQFYAWLKFTKYKTTTKQQERSYITDVLCDHYSLGQRSVGLLVK